MKKNRILLLSVCCSFDWLKSFQIKAKNNKNLYV